MKNFVFVLCALSIFSCKQDAKEEIKGPPSYSDTKENTSINGDLNATETIAQVTFTTEEASLIHEAYLELKGALVNTDATDAAEIAADFKQMLSAVGDAEELVSLKTNIDLIAQSKNVKEQRIAFENVSKDVENYLSNYIASGSLIKQYCPMAFNGKGAYWLSDSKEIRNPYFGDVMLNCGVVDKEIN